MRYSASGSFSNQLHISFISPLPYQTLPNEAGNEWPYRQSTYCYRIAQKCTSLPPFADKIGASLLSERRRCPSARFSTGRFFAPQRQHSIFSSLHRQTTSNHWRPQQNYTESFTGLGYQQMMDRRTENPVQNKRFFLEVKNCPQLLLTLTKNIKQLGGVRSRIFGSTLDNNLVFAFFSSWLNHSSTKMSTMWSRIDQRRNGRRKRRHRLHRLPKLALLTNLLWYVECLTVIAR